MKKLENVEGATCIPFTIASREYMLAPIEVYDVMHIK